MKPPSHSRGGEGPPGSGGGLEGHGREGPQVGDPRPDEWKPGASQAQGSVLAGWAGSAEVRPGSPGDQVLPRGPLPHPDP